MASTINHPTATPDAALARRSAVVAAVGWVAVVGCALGAAVIPDSRELFGCVALLAFLAAYGFSTRAVFFAARSPHARGWVLFLEGMRRRVTDEPRIDATRSTT